VSALFFLLFENKSALLLEFNSMADYEGSNVHQGLTFDALYAKESGEYRNLIVSMRNEVLKNFPMYDYARELSILAIAPQNEDIKDLLKKEAKRISDRCTAFYNGLENKIRTFINEGKKHTANANLIIGYAHNKIQAEAKAEWDLVQMGSEALGIPYFTGKAKSEIGNPSGLGDVPSKAHMKSHP
jgi:hypothetical protein